MSLCCRRLRFAYSSDNPDNLRCCGFFTVAFAVSVAIAALVPYLGYVAAALGYDRGHNCTTPGLDYLARYDRCGMLGLGAILVLLLCVCALFLCGVMWRVALPKLRDELCAAWKPLDEIDDGEEGYLLATGGTRTVGWPCLRRFLYMFSLRTPDRLVQSTIQVSFWIAVVVTVAVGGAFIVVVLTLFGLLGEAIIFPFFIAPANTNVSCITLPYGQDCLGRSFLLLCLSALLAIILWQTFTDWLPALSRAFKRDEEIDVLRADRVRDAAL